MRSPPADDCHTTNAEFTVWLILCMGATIMFDSCQEDNQHAQWI
jgi:hypothetical protein